VIEIVKGSTSLKETAFSPNPVKVKAGTTVTWKNVDTAVHTIVSGKDLKDAQKGKMFDSSKKPLGPNKEFSFKFDKKGTFDYFCGLHPNMVGKVTVE
jgi:plastocyanin